MSALSEKHSFVHILFNFSQPVQLIYSKFYKISVTETEKYFLTLLLAKTVFFTIRLILYNNKILIIAVKIKRVLIN
jgi:cell division protein FtsL